MKKYERLVLLALPLLVVAQLVFAKPMPLPIVNMHESVEGVAEVVKLQEVMKTLGITQTVLHGIPADLLSFKGDAVDLSDVEENNAALEQVKENYPDEFSFFCSIDPSDPLRIEKLKECLAAGAQGVKLYNGYSYAHQTPIDDAQLSGFYDLLTEEKALLMLPVNTEKYADELNNLLTLYPDLNVICPHFCLSSKDLDRLTTLMNKFPNLYVDTSFGNQEFAKEGFETLSENQEAFQTFFKTFQDRILFGTDAVLTSYEDKDIEWLTKLYTDYLSLFKETSFESALFVGDVYQGLGLPLSIQNKVFNRNWMNLKNLNNL